MKLVHVALATIADVGSALPFNRAPATRGLNDDLDKFIALVPKEQIAGIAMNYLANDAKVQEAITYLTSDDFKSLVLEVESFAEYKSYLQGHGLDVLAAIKKLHEILGLPEYVPARLQTRRGAVIRDLLDDIKAVLPIDDLKALFYETLKTSPDFANLANVLKGDEFKGFFGKFLANPKFQEIVVQAKEHGVDIALIVDLLNKILGWGIENRRFSSTYGILDDLEDFLALVHKDKIIAIVVDYLAMKFRPFSNSSNLRTSKILSKKLTVGIPEYIKFLNTHQSKGLDVYGLVNKLHELLGLPTLPVSSRVIACRGQGVRGLIDDIKAVLRIDQIKALFHEKLDNSPDFASLVNYMKGEEFQTIVKALRANPKFQEIVVGAKQHGVDVQLIGDLLKKIFGWDFGY